MRFILFLLYGCRLYRSIQGGGVTGSCVNSERLEAGNERTRISRERYKCKYFALFEQSKLRVY